MTPAPPRWLLRFFRWYCHPKLHRHIEGDLFELYHEHVREGGKRKADFRFALDVLLLFRPSIIRPANLNTRLNTYDMLKTYFIIGWRNLAKQRLYSSIKIGGFAIGIAACLLITLYIKNELSYDKHYANHKQLYRVLGVLDEGNGYQAGVPFPAPMAAALKEDFPEIVEAGRYNASELFGAGSNEVRPGNEVENSYDAGFTYFDQSLLDMLQIPFVHGSANRALEQPRSIVITQRKAEKYFPNENPVGKTLIINNEVDKPYTVGGVIEDFKPTSHIQFDFLISTSGLEFWQDEQKDWGASNYAIYVQVAEGTDIAQLEKKVSKGIIDKYFLPMMLSNGMTQADVEKFFAEKKAHLELQPLSRIHLHSSFVEGGSGDGDIRFVWLFGGIAAFILLIAMINFINLSTAKSANRAKEVGLRKVVGSVRGNIVGQFLTESVLFSIFSFVVGIALARLFLPYFNILLNKTLFFPTSDALFWLVIALASIVIGVLAGLYPSFYLSSFQPIQVLKGNVSKGSKSSPLRSALVIFQFTTSIVLMVGTVVIYRQMDYILHKEIGFEKDQVVLIQGAGTLGKQLPTFKNELLTLPNVQGVSLSDYLPVRGTKRNQNQFWKEGASHTQDESVNAQIWRVDTDYLKTMGMHIADGRNFDANLLTDSTSMIVNEAMAKQLGGNVLNMRISNGGDDIFTIVGVVKDFHFESMKQHIEPLCFTLGSRASAVAVKVSTSDMTNILAAIDERWRKFAPHQPIRYNFLDDRYAAMYADVERMGRIFTVFALLAIVVACLGLFALSTFLVEQRSKEIGIRLVLGASLGNIFRILTTNFITLVLISFVLATPLAWYLMQQWLQDFSYRIPLGADVFILSGVVAVLIAMLTITYHALKAGRIDPVKSLKAD